MGWYFSKICDTISRWFPSKEFQVEWIRQYLTAYYQLTAQNAAITDQKVFKKAWNVYIFYLFCVSFN